MTCPSPALDVIDGWPRLSEDLPGPRHLYRCQACGLTCSPPTRELWQEHNEADRPEPRVVVLCASCSPTIVPPHPRLYRMLSPNEPIPGSLGLCEGCAHQDRRAGLSCGNPRARQNGGAGLSIQIAKPSSAHLCLRGRDGRRAGQWIKVWPSQATGCSGREVPAA